MSLFQLHTVKNGVYLYEVYNNSLIIITINTNKVTDKIMVRDSLWVIALVLSRLDAIVIIMLPLIFVIQTNSMQHVNIRLFIPAGNTPHWHR